MYIIGTLCIYYVLYMCVLARDCIIINNSSRHLGSICYIYATT